MTTEHQPPDTPQCTICDLVVALVEMRDALTGVSLMLKDRRFSCLESKDREVIETQLKKLFEQF